MSADQPRQQILPRAVSSRAFEAIEPFPKGVMVHFAHKFCNGFAEHFDVVRLNGSQSFEVKHLRRDYELLEVFHMDRDDMSPSRYRGMSGRIRLALRRLVILVQFCVEYHKVIGAVARRRPDYVLFATVFRYPLMGIFLRRLSRRGVRCLQVCHEFEMREERKRLTSRLLWLMNRKVYRHFDVIYFLSQSQLDAFRKFAPEIDRSRLHVIPIGNSEIFVEMCSDESTTSVANRYQLQADRPVVLFLGRVRTDKGVEDLIEAVALLKKRSSENRVAEALPQTLIAGHTPLDLANRLRRRFAQEDLDNDIFLSDDYVPSEEIGHLMQLAQVTVFPYRSSSQSAALQTAMAFGKAIVASDVGGIGEVIEDERNGLLVPSRDPVALADAIEKLLVDQSLRDRLGNAALEESRTTFSWQRVVETMMHAMQETPPHA